MNQYHSCEQCKHSDYVRGVHPIRCHHPSVLPSKPVEFMRSAGGSCGITAVMWERRAQK